MVSGDGGEGAYGGGGSTGPVGGVERAGDVQVVGGEPRVVLGVAPSPTSSWAGPVQGNGMRVSGWFGR